MCTYICFQEYLRGNVFCIFSDTCDIYINQVGYKYLVLLYICMAGFLFKIELQTFDVKTYSRLFIYLGENMLSIQDFHIQKYF